MSETNGRCEFESQDYCCLPDYIVKTGFKCPSALPIQEGDICEKCGSTDDDFLSYEEWELQKHM